MESRTDPWRRLVIPDVIHPVHDLDPSHSAPAGHEGARERCIREADRESINFATPSSGMWTCAPPDCPSAARWPSASVPIAKPAFSKPRREACGPSPRRLLISFSTPGRSRHLHRR